MVGKYKVIILCGSTKFKDSIGLKNVLLPEDMLNEWKEAKYFLYLNVLVITHNHLTTV